MKSIVKLGALLGCGFVLVGCSNNTPQTTESVTEATTVNPVKRTDDIETTTTQQSSAYSFKDGKAVLQDIDLQITEYKVLKAGNPENQMSEKDIIVFYYNVTNKSDKDITPMAAWLAVFGNSKSIVQDNDKNRVNSLKVAPYNDSNIDVQQGLDTIKKGGTVTYYAAYELSDLKTPVRLTAFKGFDNIELGTLDFNVAD